MLQSCEHAVVYRDDEYFAAWPFNGGLWQFADGEVAAGFVRGRCTYEDASTHHHEVDNARGEHMVIRSRDGGVNWDADDMTLVYRRPDLDESLRQAPPWLESEAPADPNADGFCLLAGFGIPPHEDQKASFIMRSLDRGRTWSRPLRPAAYRYNFLSIRPGYCVRDDGTILIFGIANDAPTPTEADAFPVVYASKDGGVHWHLLGHIEPVPRKPMCIMGDPLILPDGTILAAFRREHGHWAAYTQIYRSLDGGRTWAFLSRPNDWGAPANLVRLPDGRIVCVYGYRQAPCGIRACCSEDGGATWGPEFILRADGGSADLGYPRTLLRPDGSLLTVYYFNDRDDPIQHHGGVRYIVATSWRI